MTSKSVILRIDVYAFLGPYHQRNRMNFHRNTPQITEEGCRNFYRDRSCVSYRRRLRTNIHTYKYWILHNINRIHPSAEVWSGNRAKTQWRICDSNHLHIYLEYAQECLDSQELYYGQNRQDFSSAPRRTVDLGHMVEVNQITGTHPGS